MANRLKPKAVELKSRTRNRRTNAQLFVDKLAKLAGGGSTLISNKALREALGWDEARYLRIRKGLVNQNKIIVGRGYGGSVGLASAPGTKALTVFVSYTHTDEAHKNQH